MLGGIPGTGFADWPITYEELEPYYTKVDWEIGVSGLADSSPFDPPRSKPYPMPPLPVKSSGVMLEKGARTLGLHAFPAPMAIVSQPYRGRPGLRALRLLHRLRLRSHGEVLDAVHHDSGGGSHRPLRDSAAQLCLQRGARQARPNHRRALLRRGISASNFRRPRPWCSRPMAPKPRVCCSIPRAARFPQGLANSSGLVGKYLMFNQGSGVHALFEHELNEYKSVQVTRDRARLL